MPSKERERAQDSARATEVLKKGITRHRRWVSKLIVPGIVLSSVFAIWIGASLSHQPTSAPPPRRTVPVQPEKPSANIPERAAVSLSTGTLLIRPRGVKGNGVLTISNGTGLDAVVKLVSATPPHVAIWMVYIRAHDETVRSGIAAGSYLLRFALGLDWNVTTTKFLRTQEFYQAGQHFDFVEIEPTFDKPGTYDEVKISLDPVPFGDIPREPIDELTFNEGDPTK